MPWGPDVSSPSALLSLQPASPAFSGSRLEPRTALGLAPHTFATKQSIADLYVIEQAAREDQEQLLAKGHSDLDRRAWLSA